MTEKTDIKMKKCYRFEVGILLTKDNPEYDNYIAYNNKSYYNENWGCCQTKKEALEYVKNYIKSGVVNTYGIIGIEEIENEDFKKIHNGYLENVEYGCIRKIFYSKFKNGKNEIKDLYLRK